MQTDGRPRRRLGGAAWRPCGLCPCGRVLSPARPDGRRRPVGASCVDAPLADELVLQPELVEAPADDEVDELIDRLPAVVEAGRREQDDGTGASQAQEILEVNGRE